MTVPHLKRYQDADCIARWHVTVNNHLRNMLWVWWSAKGVRVETTEGRMLVRNVDAWSASSLTNVKKALAFSNNGEDFNLFVDWVAGYTFDVVENELKWVRVKHAAPTNIVNALMNNGDRRTAIDLIWKHCIMRMQGEQKIYQLKSRT